MILLENKKVVFIHNPKAMGTSITKALELNGNIKLIGKKHSKIGELPKTYMNYFKFGIIRNTYEWIVSGYLYNKKMNNRPYKNFKKNWGNHTFED